MHPTILQKVWQEVSYEKALEKVMHRLREKDTNATKNDHHSNAAANNGDFAVAAARHVGSSQLAHQPDAIYSDQSDDFDTLVERIADPYDIGRQECPR